ncbi:MAG: hypothetical protein AABW67_04940 [Nanoarchaeota archaeon]
MAKKKKTEKINENKDKINLKKKQNKQILWAIVLMVSLILIIVIVPIIKTNFISKFTYIGLDFQKTQLGNMYFYTTSIPVANNLNEVVGTFSINFRNDPRKLEDITIKKTTTVPIFRKENVVYISTGKVERNCKEGVPAMLTLAGFLREFAQMNVSAGISDKQFAEEMGFPYITCANSQKNNTVIEIIEGSETKITQTDPNCYKLEYADCDVLKVSEKFIFSILEGYMNKFEKKKSSFWGIFG